MACQQGVGFAHPAAASPAKGFDMATSAARHGHPAARRPSGTPRRRDTAVDTPTQDVLCHRAPPRHVHDMVSHRVIFIRAFVLSQRLHLVSIVCDVSVGRRRGLSGACYSARKHRPVGLRPAASLFLLYILPFSLCTLLVLGRNSSRAIPGVFCIAGATCGGLLPQIRAETDGVCSHAGRKRYNPAAFATTLFFLPYHFLLGGSALNVPRLTPKWPLCVRLVCSFQAKEGRTTWARLALER